MSGLFGLGQAVLLAFDPERAHELAVKTLELGLYPRASGPDDSRLRQTVFGLDFPNPIGMAAGFDKNAKVPRELLAMGFGFVEVGTLTPRPQPGNPAPRIFRSATERAIVNRLGFNNDGHDAALVRLRSRPSGIVGVNIGAGKDSADRVADYVQGIERFRSVASYFTVNVSSPNTPGLRDLQEAKSLDDLLARVVEARDHANRRAGPVPVLLKVAPDLSLSQLDDVVGVARKHRVDGMIVGNTTISRPQSLRDRDRGKEIGGLSGRPLFKLSTRMLAETYVRAEGAFPLIGVGGIDSGSTAIAKIKAGASLLQLYTGLVYRGLGLVDQIKSDLVAALKRGQRDSLSSMVGSDAAAITAESWPS
jgi:dihydroorotate dehydrogenase